MITREDVLAKVSKVYLHHFPGTTTIVCALQLTNGHVVVGEAHCAHDTPFSTQLGAEFAREDAESKVKTLLAYEQRNTLEPKNG